MGQLFISVQVGVRFRTVKSGKPYQILTLDQEFPFVGLIDSHDREENIHTFAKVGDVKLLIYNSVIKWDFNAFGVENI